MSKRMLNVEAPAWEAPASPNAFSLEIETITPLFGGGYKTREWDELIPIRSATVRGHLRFWWRATAGAQFSSVQELYERECELWGGPSTKEKSRVGKVGVRVEILQKGTAKPFNEIAPKSTSKEGPRHGFFLFPFQEVKKQEIPAASGLEGVRFKLYIDYTGAVDDQQKQEVQTAIKAWLTFGGVGARTRRGCGALKALNGSDWLLPDNPNEREQFLKQLLACHSRERDYPTLAGAIVVVGNPQNDPTKVWAELGQFWARFRKGHFNMEYKPMSGGKWNDYRDVLCRLEEFSDTIPLAKPFLGLPIIYQAFPNASFKGTIEPAESGRMASPVILKPVALSKGKYAPLIVVLRAKAPANIKIKQDSHERVYTLQPPRKDPVLRALQASDVLDAVVKAAEQHFDGAQVIHIPAGGTQ